MNNMTQKVKEVRSEIFKMIFCELALVIVVGIIIWDYLEVFQGFAKYGIVFCMTLSGGLAGAQMRLYAILKNLEKEVSTLVLQEKEQETGM